MENFNGKFIQELSLFGIKKMASDRQTLVSKIRLQLLSFKNQGDKTGYQISDGHCWVYMILTGRAQRKHQESPPPILSVLDVQASVSRQKANTFFICHDFSTVSQINDVVGDPVKFEAFDEKNMRPNSTNLYEIRCQQDSPEIRGKSLKRTSLDWKADQITKEDFAKKIPVGNRLNMNQVETKMGKPNHWEIENGPGNTKLNEGEMKNSWQKEGGTKKEMGPYIGEAQMKGQMNHGWQGEKNGQVDGAPIKMNIEKRLPNNNGTIQSFPQDTFDFELIDIPQEEFSSRQPQPGSLFLPANPPTKNQFSNNNAPNNFQAVHINNQMSNQSFQMKPGEIEIKMNLKPAVQGFNQNKGIEKPNQFNPGSFGGKSNMEQGPGNAGFGEFGVFEDEFAQIEAEFERKKIAENEKKNQEQEGFNFPKNPFKENQPQNTEGPNLNPLSSHKQIQGVTNQANWLGNQYQSDRTQRPAQNRNNFQNKNPSSSNNNIFPAEFPFVPNDWKNLLNNPNAVPNLGNKPNFNQPSWPPKEGSNTFQNTNNPFASTVSNQLADSKTIPFHLREETPQNQNGFPRIGQESAGNYLGTSEIYLLPNGNTGFPSPLNQKPNQGTSYNRFLSPFSPQNPVPLQANSNNFSPFHSNTFRTSEFELSKEVSNLNFSVSIPESRQTPTIMPQNSEQFLKPERGNINGSQSVPGCTSKSKISWEPPCNDSNFGIPFLERQSVVSNSNRSFQTCLDTVHNSNTSGFLQGNRSNPPFNLKQDPMLIEKGPQSIGFQNVTGRKGPEESGILCECIRVMVKDLPVSDEKWRILVRVKSKTNEKQYFARGKHGSYFKVVFEDETGEILCSFFNSSCDHYINKINRKRVYSIQGAVVKELEPKFRKKDIKMELVIKNSTQIIEEPDDLVDIPLRLSMTGIPQLKTKSMEEAVDVAGIILDPGSVENICNKKLKRVFKIFDESLRVIEVTVSDEPPEAKSLCKWKVVVLVQAKLIILKNQTLLVLDEESDIILDSELSPRLLKSHASIEKIKKLYGLLKLENLESRLVSVDEDLDLGKKRTCTIEMIDKYAKDLLIQCPGKPRVFTLSAFISFITPYSVIFKACPLCTSKKKVQEGPDKSWFCSECNQYFKQLPITSFYGSILISDESGEIWATLGNPQGESLFKTTALDLLSKSIGEEVKTDREEFYLQEELEEFFNQFKNIEYKMTIKAYSTKSKISGEWAVNYSIETISKDFRSENNVLIETLKKML